MGKKLAFQGPLDLEATLYSGQAFRWVPEGQGWHFGFIRNEPVHVRSEADVLTWRSGPRLREDQVRHYFRLDESHLAFLQAAPKDAFLRTALSRFPGLRLLRQDPWETFISFIISQNSNERKIRNTIEKLSQRAGRRAGRGRPGVHRFPTAAALATLADADLRATGMGYRAAYVKRAARLVARGRLRPASWVQRRYEDAFEELLRVHGVGEKVADCILLYGCDQRRAFPSDVWVRRLLGETYLPRPRRPSYAAIRDFAWKHFGAEAGYAQHYLFHYRRRVGALAASPA
ncbi:MAG: hypothetical protein HYT80_06590 [Euryarchaeota archaeon]|nr:hypothetical protein [Euryarchaeota archaeon]